jgi:hypothetical protein
MLISVLPISVFAAEEKVYVKEVRISTAADENSAKQWLINNGYQVLDFNLNQKSNADAVYMGYITTTNPDEAITDIAVMQMEGGYSFSQFEAALQRQAENVNDALRAIEETIREARQKYAAGNENAMGAYQILNYFLEEDSGKLMGDYLLVEQIDANDLSKVMLQSNSDFSILLYSMLAWACTDIGEDVNWMSKLENKDPYGEYDDVYYRDLALKIFDDYETIYESLVSFETYFGCDAFDIKNLTDEELEAFAADVSEEQINDFGLYVALSLYDYAGKPLVEFFKNDPNEIAIEDLYPILDAMSEGQRHIVDFVGLNTLIFYAQNDAESAKTYIDTCISDFLAYEIYDPISIYTGVDRSIFTDGGVALTSASLRESASTGDSGWYNEENIDDALAGILHVVAGGAVITAVAVPIYASKTWAVEVASAAAMKEEGRLFGMFSDLYRQDLEKKTMFKEVIEELQWNYGVTSEKELQILAQTTHPELAPNLHEISERRLIHENYIEGQISKNNKLIDKKYDEVFESVMKKAKQIAMVALGVSLVAEAIVIGVKLYNYYHPEYSVIPRIIVDNVVTDTESYYVRYYATTDQSGEYADLNAWKGQRWNALYTTKDKDAGDPILASGLTAKLKDSSMPTAQSYAVHYFGETGACDVSRYLLKAKAPETYIFFTRDHSLRATASAFSRGTVITFACIGLVSGLAIGSLGVIGTVKLKKKKKGIVANAAE